MEKNRNCEICKVEFAHKRRDVTVCSDLCRRARKKEYDQVSYQLHRQEISIQSKKNYVRRMKIKNCLICNHEFLPQTSSAKTCSPVCSRAWGERYFQTWYEKNRKPSFSHVCDVCYKRFIGRKSRKRCSKECSMIGGVRNLKKYNKTPNMQVYSFIRDTVERVLVSTKPRTREYVDYTNHQLRSHLENQFTVGMTWETRGRKGWRIDHIKPLSAFKCVDENGNAIIEEIRKAMALSNLQPLWYYDNVRKSGMNRPENRKLYQLTAEGA